MDKDYRVIVMTQNDRFFIPKNIAKLSRVCRLLAVVEVDCKSSLDNKLSDYYRWFGPWQCAKMAVVTVGRELEKYLDRLCGYRAFHGFCSVRDVARALGVEHRVIADSNDGDYVAWVRSLHPDLIVSYSAPQIIRDELLRLPRDGIINVHGSLLPDYRGCLPSFWYLYNGETRGGATVHYMSGKLDDGDIIEQEQTDISDCRSMFRLIRRTKELGGELMVKAVEAIRSGTVKARPNRAEEGRYFTWPTVEQAREFRKKGYRLI